MSFMQRIKSMIFSPIVPVIRITGLIDQSTTLDVHNGLQQINPLQSKAIAVVINSPGGSPTQADLIIQKLQLYSEKNHLPIYTFAEEVAMASGYYLLCAGNKIYADQTSQIGYIGQDPKYIGLEQEANKNSYKFTNERDLWFNRFEDFQQLSKEESSIMKSMNQKQHNQFLDYINQQRELQVQDLKLQDSIIDGEKAKNIGLVDDIGNYHEIMGNKYPLANIILAQQQSTRQKFHMYMSQALQIIRTVNQRQKKSTKLENDIKN